MICENTQPPFSPFFNYNFFKHLRIHKDPHLRVHEDSRSTMIDISIENAQIRLFFWVNILLVLLCAETSSSCSAPFNFFYLFIYIIFLASSSFFSLTNSLCTCWHWVFIHECHRSGFRS